MVFWAIALLIAGAVFLIIEMFLPGFGFFGITGIILAVVSIVLTVMFVPFGGIVALCEFAVIALLLFLLFQYMKKTQSLSKIILTDTIEGEPAEITDYEYFLEKTAMTVTSLRPYGDADFNGRIVGVYSDGEYIPEQKRVKVTRVDRARIIVERIGN